MSQVGLADYLRELRSVEIELKEVNLRAKELRNAKKDLKDKVKEILLDIGQQGAKYEDYIFKITQKPRRPMKKKFDREISVIDTLRTFGVEKEKLMECYQAVEDARKKEQVMITDILARPNK